MHGHFNRVHDNLTYWALKKGRRKTNPDVLAASTEFAPDVARNIGPNNYWSDKRIDG